MRAQRAMLLRLEVVRVAAKMVEEHVQVADVSERRAEPAELRAQRLRPFFVEQRRAGLQERAQSPRRDAHLVQLLRVTAEPRTRIVRDDGAILSLERRLVVLGRRRVLAGDLGLGGHLAAESPEELRSPVAVRGAGLPQGAVDPFQPLLVALDQLDLELAERAEALAVVVDADGVDRHVRDGALVVPDPHARALRAERGDGGERRPAKVRGQQLDDVRRCVAGTAGHLELEARRSARQLQLPDALAVLDAAAERHSCLRKPEVRRVVVDGRQRASRERATGELRQPEGALHGELELTLQGLLHPRHDAGLYGTASPSRRTCLGVGSGRHLSFTVRSPAGHSGPPLSRPLSRPGGHRPCGPA